MGRWKNWRWVVVVSVAMGAAMLSGGAIAAASINARAAKAPQTAPAASSPAAPPAQVTAAATNVASATPATQGGTIHGTVVAGTPGKAGGIPLPGVAVTATNTLTGKKYAAATDINGSYSMTIPKNGRYVVRAELTGFAAATQEVVLNGVEARAERQAITIVEKPMNFAMELASRAAAAEAKEEAAASAGSAAQSSGVQGLSLSAGDLDATDASSMPGDESAGEALPSLAGVGDSTDESSDSVAVNGQQGQMNGLADFSEDEVRQHIQDAVDRAKASGMLAPGADPTDAIVGMLGGMMGSDGGGGSHSHSGGGGGGGGGGHHGGGGGSGAFRNFNPAQVHGSLFYSGDFSELDSAGWSNTLRPTAKPTYLKNSFGASFAGSPYIPGLTKPDPKQFVFLSLTGKRNTTPEILTGPVPTLAERAGDFSALPQMIYDPLHPGMQFVNDGSNPTEPAGTPNVIPELRLTSQALAVLNYYPAPNITSVGAIGNNYQTVTTAGQNTTNVSARYVRTIGGAASNPFAGFMRHSNGPAALRQNLNSGFTYSHSASDERNIFLPLGGATESTGFNLNAGYTIGYGRLSNHSTVTWNRSHAQTRNYFTDTANDPAAVAGISLPSTGAIGFRPNFYNGLPNLSITGFSSLTNTAPSDSIGQTISFSDFLSYRHNKHNMRFGLDVRRVHADSLGGNSPLGTFTFSGYATESPTDQVATTTPCAPLAGNPCTTNAQPSTGSGFADLLIGQPQQTTIQAGLNKIYLRENVVDWYAQDDWRARSNLTVNYGLRYEYFGPYSEKNNRLTNLTGITTLTTSVGCVTPTGFTGTVMVGGVAQTLNCAKGPNAALIQPDHAMYAPRFGVAYRLKNSGLTRDTVLRGGYGLNFNTEQFASFAKSLSYQPPFAAVQNNVLATSSNATGCAFTNETLANGFGCSNKLYQNSFAVNPNYRIGYVQVYNLDIQRTLPAGIVLNLGYNGSKGSDQNVTLAPNHTSTTVTTPDAVAFTYQTSIAASNFNALTINARKRLEGGVSLQATYQYAHSIDDASSFGGASSTSSVQNSADLEAERSNSSFDVRHKLTGNWLYELPVGPNRKFLSQGGIWAAALDGFSVSGSFTFASGTPYTPTYQSSAAEIAAGGTYTLRPDRVFTQPIRGAGTLNSFFNEAAFAFPASPTGYGTASRYSIEGPGQLVIDAALSRTVKLGDTRSFEGRVQAANVFNTVQYSGINTTLNSPTYGQVTSAATMRDLLFIARFRF